MAEPPSSGPTRCLLSESVAGYRVLGNSPEITVAVTKSANRELRVPLAALLSQIVQLPAECFVPLAAAGLAVI